MLIAKCEGRNSEVSGNRRKSWMTDDEEVSLDAVKELWQLERTCLADGVVRNVAVGFNQLLQSVLILSSSVIDRVMMEYQGTFVLYAQFCQYADKSVGISRTGKHHTMLALEELSELCQFRSYALVLALNVLLSLLLLAHHLGDVSEPFVSTFDTVWLWSVNLWHAKLLLKGSSHISAESFAECCSGNGF